MPANALGKGTSAKAETPSKPDHGGDSCSTVSPPSCCMSRQSNESSRSTLGSRHKGRRLLDKWEMAGGRPLGEGSVGRVELAHPIGGGAPCAVKLVSKIDRCSEAAIQEAKIMRPLDHPSICRLLDVCDDDSYVYLILEFIDGRDLFGEIEVISRTSDEQRARQIMSKVLQALAYCHDRKIVHRDIKPENIMISGTGSDAPCVKIIDFGLAIEAGSMCKDPVGTPHYWAPEARCGSRVETPVDIWSAGVVLHGLLTGKYLPEGMQFGHTPEDLETGALASKNISDGAKDLLSGLVHGDPKQRLTAAEALNHPWLARGLEQ